MKKIILRVLIALVVMVVLVVLGVRFFMDGAIRQEVQTIGSKLTKVEVKLNSVHISLLSGAGALKGFSMANPQGFSSNSAIAFGTASVALQPSSVLSPKVLIRSVTLEAPEISLEGTLQAINLKEILGNLGSSSGGATEPAKPTETRPAETKPAETKAGKKLEVDDFVVSGGKIHLSLTTPLGSQSGTVPLPEIHLKDLGKGSDGITSTELATLVLNAILEKSLEAGLAAAKDIKGVSDLTKGLGGATGGTGAVDKVTKGLGDLFQKKK
jgi:hypothetical protein